jgi:hypothetical protein
MPMKVLGIGRYAVPAVLLLWLLCGCQELFTYSVFSSLARPTKVPANLTVNQAQTMAADAISNGDTAMATKLVSTFIEMMKNTTDPVQKAELQAQAVDLAVTGSNIAAALTQAVPQIMAVSQSNGSAQAQNLEDLKNTVKSLSASIDTTTAQDAAAIIQAMPPENQNATQMMMIAAVIAVQDTKGDLSNTTAISVTAQDLAHDALVKIEQDPAQAAVFSQQLNINVPEGSTLSEQLVGLLSLPTA